MKSTNYLHTFPLKKSKETNTEEDILVYNAMTNALAVMEPEKYKIFEAFFKNGIPIKDTELLEQLKEGGFIISDDFDELEELHTRMWGGRFGNNALTLTIAVTADCNFRCVYCYEQGVIRDTYMTDEVINGIKELFNARIPHIRHFSVTWYGGEPLLALDTIKELSNYFIEKCDENNVDYNAGIITNGYLLSRDVVETLNKLRVNFYQITIDGNKETHNKRRFLANGEGTFDVIWDNLIKSSDILPRVSLRVNVDRTNIQVANEIADMIIKMGIDKVVHPYLGRVLNDNDDSKLEATCMSLSEYSDTELSYSIKYSKEDYIAKYPNLRSNFCGADAMSTLVIDADGCLYKCWNEIGHKEISVGTVLDSKKLGDINHLNGYLLYDPTQDPKCSKCKVLPLCMGGCPYYRLTGKSQYQCSVFKSNLQNYISFVAESIIGEREKNKQTV